MSDARIKQAFEVALDSWAKGQTPQVPVAWPNSDYTPDRNLFVRPYLLPAKTKNAMLVGNHREYMGIFQISVYTPRGEGDGPGRAIAVGFDSVFNPSTTLVNGGLRVHIIDPVSTGPAMNDGGWYIIPVSIGYLANEVK